MGITFNKEDDMAVQYTITMLEAEQMGFMRHPLGIGMESSIPVLTVGIAADCIESRTLTRGEWRVLNKLRRSWIRIATPEIPAQSSFKDRQPGRWQDVLNKVAQGNRVLHAALFPENPKARGFTEQEYRLQGIRSRLAVVAWEVAHFGYSQSGARQRARMAANRGKVYDG